MHACLPACLALFVGDCLVDTASTHSRHIHTHPPRFHQRPHPPQEEPVDAAEYRALLDAMMRELGDRTGYSFVKENRDTEQAEVRLNAYIGVLAVFGFPSLPFSPRHGL